MDKNNTTKTKISSTLDLIKHIESKYIKNERYNENQKVKIEIGDIVKIGYLIPEGEKERTQYYEGIIIAIKNKGIGKSFILRRTVQGIGIEQIFVLNSPKILSIVKKQASTVRRAKLYFLRDLRGKSTKLKVRIVKPKV